MKKGLTRFYLKKAADGCVERNRMQFLTEAERKELKRIASELHNYADHVIGREIDADDLKFAVDCAVSRNDLDLLRVYDKCAYSLTFDVYITDHHVNVLRKNGYATVAGFYDTKTEEIALEVTAALVNEESHGAISLTNRDSLCAYAMANSHLAPLIQKLITERHIFEYEEIVSLIEQSQNAVALSDGAL